MKKDEAYKKIMFLLRQIDDYWKSLNIEGVWLFVTTLGCWSVSEKSLCIFALFISAAIFVIRIYVRLPIKETFLSQIEELQSSVKGSAEVEDSVKNQYIVEIENIKNKKLSILNSLSNVVVFGMCFMFWAFTFNHFIHLI